MGDCCAFLLIFELFSLLFLLFTFIRLYPVPSAGEIGGANGYAGLNTAMNNLQSMKAGLVSIVACCKAFCRMCICVSLYSTWLIISSEENCSILTAF